MRKRCVSAAVLLAGSIFTARSQDIAPIRAGTWELNGAAGYTYGINELAGNRSRVNGGATLSYAVTKQLLPYFEYSYFPGITRERLGIPVSGAGGTIDEVYAIPLTDFHAGIHYRFTIAESRLAPYAVFGLGGLRSSGRRVDVTIRNELGTITDPRNVESSTDFAVNFGGGLRYYIGQYWGVRVEGKAYRPTTGQFDNTFGKLQFGIFWQFGGR
jgi:hypothetical protein